jgi:hypothetical protein
MSRVLVLVLAWLLLSVPLALLLGKTLRQGSRAAPRMHRSDGWPAMARTGRPARWTDAPSVPTGRFAPESAGAYESPLAPFDPDRSRSRRARARSGDPLG